MGESTREMDGFHGLKKCDKPDCVRQVRKGVEYCCGPCRTADEGGYETHEDGPLGHTIGCNARHAERSQR